MARGLWTGKKAGLLYTLRSRRRYTYPDCLRKLFGPLDPSLSASQSLRSWTFGVRCRIARFDRC